jgi:hypothetical protein
MTAEPMATLRLDLKDHLLAFELDAVIDAVNDTYTALRWLELAERDPGAEPYSDAKFEYDEFLTVERVEIGTPNFVEFHGLYENLQQALVYLAVVHGVANVGMSVAGRAIKLYRQWLEAKWKGNPARLEAELKLAQERVRRMELGNAKLQRALDAAGKAVTPESIPERAKRLRRRGKASDVAAEYKARRSKEIGEKLESWRVNDVVQAATLLPDDPTN